MLFTASSVRVDRRGTCSIGSKAAAAPGYAGSHRRCRAHSLKATLRIARATPDPVVEVHEQVAVWPHHLAATYGVSKAASREIHIGSMQNKIN